MQKKFLSKFFLFTKMTKLEHMRKQEEIEYWLNGINGDVTVVGHSAVEDGILITIEVIYNN